MTDPALTNVGEAAAERLRQLVRDELAHASFTQAEVADGLDVSEGRVSHVLTGRKPLSPEFAAAVLAVAGRELHFTTAPLAAPGRRTR